MAGCPSHWTSPCGTLQEVEQNHNLLTSLNGVFCWAHAATCNRGDDTQGLNLPKIWQTVLLSDGHGQGAGNMVAFRFNSD